MKRFFQNIPWKNILLVTLVAALGIGAIVGIGTALSQDEKTISSTVFERGALDDDGVYVETKRSIVTKDLIECQGLRIEPDFEATGTYQVYYYSQDKTFLGATDEMEAIAGEYKKGETFLLAKYCRIVITPDAPKDDNGYVDHDFEIAFYQVLGFANDYTITVNKKQGFNVENALKGNDNQANMLGEGIWDKATNAFKSQTSQMYFFDKVNVASGNVMVMKVATSTLTNKVTYSDGQIFEFPYIYDGLTGNVLYDEYMILDQEGEFTYIAYDVSAYTSIFGVVDIDSSDILEIYVLK